MDCHRCPLQEVSGGGRLCVTVGNPNTGKSTLINALAGANLQIGNWSGTTVERLEARCRAAGVPLTLVDLPGTYSLIPTHREEDLTRQELLSLQPDAVINVIDAGNLERNLYLTLELTEVGLPLVVALNLMDEAAAKGLTLSPQALADALGVAVVPTVACRCQGVGALLSEANAAKRPTPQVRYHPAIEEALGALTPMIEHPARRWLALSALMGEVQAHLTPAAQAEAARLRQALLQRGLDPNHLIDEARWAKASALAKGALLGYHPTTTLTERIDRLVLHPVLGFPIFLVAMLLTFRFTFLLAEPWIGFIEAVQAVLGGWIVALSLPPMLASFVSEALLAGVGTVLTFVPLLFCLYLALSFLETSGFLARAAFLTDGLMKRLNLPGRALIPLILGLGCNVPGIAATRGLEHPGERLRTALAVPFISCGARLTVFALFAAVFFPGQAALVVFGLYLAGMAIALLTIALLGLLGRREMSYGVMEIPAYRLPPASLLWRLAKTRTLSFVRGAGGPILIAVTAVWALSHLPAGGEADTTLYARAAQFATPAFAPLEIHDWRLVGALVPGFVAKEVVVGTLGVSYLGPEPVEAVAFGEGIQRLGRELLASLEATALAVPALVGLSLAGPAEDDPPGGLAAALAEAVSPRGALAYLVFILLYTPCVATLAALRQVIGRRWTAFSVVYGLVVAYLMAYLAARLLS